jgi:signal transduction histidine kinase
MNLETIAVAQTGSLSAVSIVHDLRNPLAAIHGSAEVLARSTLSQRQVHRIARNMYCASVRMRELLEELLDHSRSAETALELCPVGELVAGAVDKIAVSAEFKSVQIVQAIPEGLLIPLDRRRMHRVLVNLLVNALEAMPDGGTVRISAVSGDGFVLIKVRDSGPGIAPEIRDRLFQPFTTSGKAGGLGLGLFFSRQAVIDQGGEMWAESSRLGACFAVRLPRTIPKSSTLSC